MKKNLLAMTFTLMVLGACKQRTDVKQEENNQGKETMEATEEHYTFKLSENVTRRKVTFKNRYGIEVSGDLYLPKNGGKNLSALVVSGPFGAVKEQSSGFYANQMAERGFVALAFDPSFTGESGGEVRNVASPDVFTEDYSEAVDYLGLQPEVDRNKIGAIGICGLSGMALTAATSDTRIKAVATASMYDMSKSMSRGYKNSYTRTATRSHPLFKQSTLGGC